MTAPIAVVQLWLAERAKLGDERAAASCSAPSRAAR